MFRRVHGSNLRRTPLELLKSKQKPQCGTHSQFELAGDAAFARTLIGSGVGQTGLGADVPSLDYESGS